MPSLPPVVKGYLFYDGQWNDITSDMRQTESISIERGADSEQGDVSPTAGSVLINNRSGFYSPRNPESPLFDKIGRNTPMKIAIQEGPPYLSIPASGLFNDSALVALDQDELDFTEDVDIRIDCTSNRWGQYDIAVALLLAERYDQTGDNRCWKFARHRTGHLWFGWTTDGTFGTLTHGKSTETVPFYNGERAAVRVTLDVDNGKGGYTLRFFYSNQMDGEWVELGEPVETTSGTTSVFNGNGAAPVWLGAPDDGNLPDGTGSTSMLYGKIFSYQHRDGIDGPISVDLDVASVAEVGDTTITDATSVQWSLQEDATFSNEYIRLSGEVPSWPPNRDLSGNNKDTKIEPSGIMRRLDAGNKPLESALLRYIRANEVQPVECWPLNDGFQSNGGASITGGQAMYVRIENVTTGEYELANDRYGWADGTLAKWIEPIGVPTSDTNGNITGECRNSTDAATEWSFDMFVSGINNSGSSFQAIDRTTPTDTDFAAIWNIELDKDGDAVDLLFASVGENSSSISLLEHMTDPGIFDGKPHHLRLTVQPGASSSGYDFYIDGVLIQTGTFGVGSVQLLRIRANWFLDSNDEDGYPFGFLTYWDSNAPSVTDVYTAFIGFPGETAGERFERLLFEQGLFPSVSSIGGAGGEPQFHELMGTQGLKKFLDLLRECAESDVGIFMEMRDERALALRARSTLYNQAPRFTLDFSQGLVSAPFKPTDDDKLTENDVTVTRDGGSFSRQILEEGRMSIQDTPDGVGRYDVEKTLSLFEDSQTENLAGWFLQLGTFDGLRYTRLTVDLANPRVYEMLPQILNTDLGDAIRLTNLPNEYGPDDVDLIVRGYTEEIGPEEWKITFNCSPGETWKTMSLVLDIYEGFEDTSYDIDITNDGDASWAIDTGEFHSAPSSFKSGTITGNQTSDAIVAVPPSAEKIEFWYKTSSEEAGVGFDGDRLIVLVDATPVLTAQGETDWTVFGADVSGASTVTFRYAKDAGTDVGDDAVWIDDLRFRITSPNGANIDTDGSALAEAIDTTDTSFMVSTLATADAHWVTSQISPNDFPMDVKIAGELVEVTDILPTLFDSFTRAETDTWGVADSGQTYGSGGGAGTDYDVDGTRGTHTLTSVNVSRRSFISWSVPDVDMLCDVSVSEVATGDSILGGITLRHTDGDNLYMARANFNTGGTVTLTIRERVGGTEAQLGVFTPNISYAADTPVRIRFQAKGSELKAKIWLASDTEPKQWQIEVTDTSLTASPFVGFRSILGSGNTNVNPQVKYDNVVMVSPQSFTVARSQNGVVKSHAAGADVRLAKTPIIPL